ncbi:hypothetical protein CSUB01_09897 [Colletotrichum sublineola]|uniref:Uncharacterized protein n=1 Tax=Colletotrichum sublineola TaxID=1173701 RepID=A0A066XNV1_COLSU|nr:hypothetical protein CSUB01_09897 [Colletotrichum sublineola]
MLKRATVMDGSLGQQLRFRKHFKMANWPPAGDHTLRELRRLARGIPEDPVHGAKAEAYAGFGGGPGGRWAMVTPSTRPALWPTCCWNTSGG